MQNKLLKSLVQNNTSESKVKNTSIVLVVLLLALVFHNFSLARLPKLEFIIVSIFLLKYKNYITYLYSENKFIKNVILVFFMLSIWNVISVISGMLDTYYDTKISAIALSIIYLFMLVYFLFGAVLALQYKSLNMSFIVIFISSLMITIEISEFLFPGFSHALKEYYGIYYLPEYFINPQNYRIISTLKNSNNVGLINAFFFLLTLFVVSNRLIKTPLIIGFVIVTMLTGSRTGFIIITSIVVYYFLSIRKFKNLVLIVLVFIGLLFVNNYYLKIEDTVTFQRIMRTTIETGFQTRQVGFWEEAVKMIYSSPLTGRGITEGEATSDNYYLDLLKTNGIVGLLLWLSFIFMLLIIMIKKFKTNEGKILGGFIIIILLSSFTGDFYSNRLIYPTIYTLLGFYSVKA